jgi:hypothetical protein
MKFTVSGQLRQGGITARVEWSDGKLTGESRAVCAVLTEAARREGQFVGVPDGPYTRHHHLNDSFSALLLIVGIFEPDSRMLSGDIPVRQPVPDGAVGTLFERKGAK